MFISVGIPTWNRAYLLDKTLNNMHDLIIPSDVKWELLIVNNNCTDDTNLIIEKHKRILPIKILFEKKPGRSFALNNAIREAQGEYILWTDDDALVNKNWIVEYNNAFRRWPDVSIFGGPVKPYFEGKPPQWMEFVSEKIPAAYAILDFGSKFTELSVDKIPYGVNLVVRAREQKKYIFDTSLGRSPNSMLGGEETVLVKSMLADGAKGMWIPSAIVYHYITQDRQSIKYLRKFCRGWGEYLNMKDANRDGRTLFGKPLWRWRKALKNELKYRVKKLLFSPDIWIDELILSSTDWGRLIGGGEKPVRNFFKNFKS